MDSNIKAWLAKMFYNNATFSLHTTLAFMCNNNLIFLRTIVMDRLQTSGELQDKTSFIDPSISVDLLKSCSPDYLLL